MFVLLILRHKCLPSRLNYSTLSSSNKKYSNTIFLPKTKFPLRLENQKLIERDKKITSIAEFNQLYNWQRSNLSEPEFVLHDGPPYANGSLHMGHALNKILKDTILRYEILKGHKVHYVPGWDCHGLPIELQALSKSNASALEVRSTARNFAKKTIQTQKEAFKSWGIVGDWDHHYATYTADYIKSQLKIFYKLYEKNLIYRDLKPIYWSPSSRTALAEAELEYNERHKSSSIYLRCPIKHTPNKHIDKLYALIWTTTPWTLPANQAICYNPALSYSLVKDTQKNTVYLIASDLIDNLSKTLNCNFEVVEKLKGDILSEWTYIHPIFKEKELKFVPGSHVTTSLGTGLVHTAPAHGPDDFLIALNEKMPIESLVNELGCYNSNAGKLLDGKFVLDEGNRQVLEMVQQDTLHCHDYIHKYPYDWRTKKPVIIRASKQWFLDTNSIKNRAIEVLDQVEVVPKTNSEIYKRNLINQIQKRPYWCISRQRKWGVPIPVFLNKYSEDVLLSEDLTRHFCSLIDKHGTDFWWQLPLEDLVPEELRDGISIADLEKGQDILDIWFDSGISWTKGLEGDKVANMYLEGVDQFTGWFQSSLLTSVALRDKAPYKTIYVHGFVVDENDKKMSKSLGNVLDPCEVAYGSKKGKPFGIDTLRWWVACHANQDAVARISPNVLQASADELHKIRSIIRFALGCLEDYHPSSDHRENLSLLDQYLLHLLYEFHNTVQEDIRNYKFQQVCKSVIFFLTNSISALYYTGIKDRLYCDEIENKARRGSQFILLQLFEIITQAIAPIVPHMVEEMFLHLPQKNGKTYFTTIHKKPEDWWKNDNVVKVMDLVLLIKKEINKAVGASTLDIEVELTLSPEHAKLIQEITPLVDLPSQLEDIFQVSQVKLENNISVKTFSLKIQKSKLFSCARCRRIQSENENELCRRCSQIIQRLDNKKVASI